MPVYRLSPVDLNDRDWEASTHKDECLVHATDESKARLYATREFGIATTRKPGEDVKASPWNQKGKVTAQEKLDYPPENYREGRIEVQDIDQMIDNHITAASYEERYDTERPIPYRVIADVHLDKNQVPCKICNTLAKTIPQMGDFIHQKCPRCGEFKLSGSAAASLLNELRAPEFIAKLSGWVHDHNLGAEPPIISTPVLRDVRGSQELSLTEKSQRLLLEAFRRLKRPGDTFNINELHFISATHSQDKNDVIFLYKMLADKGWMKTVSMGGTTEILPSGYEEAERLEKEASGSKDKKQTNNNEDDSLINSSSGYLKRNERIGTLKGADFFRSLNIPMTQALLDLLTVSAVYARARRMRPNTISSICLLLAAADGWKNRVRAPRDEEYSVLKATFSLVRASHTDAFNELKTNALTRTDIFENPSQAGLKINDDGVIDYDAFDFNDMDLSTNLKSTIEYSYRIADGTFGDEALSIAHLLIKLFLSPSSNLAPQLEALNIKSPKLASELGRAASFEDHLNQMQWEDFGNGAPMLKSERNKIRNDVDVKELRRVGAFSDKQTTTDSLKFSEQAAIFARLITDKQLQLPLAIGLFGNWGTGKSYFMDLMHEEISVTAGSASGVGSTYVKRVAQIEFNAWHYIDSNLWASLAVRIFEGIMHELAGKQSIPEETRAELHAKIRSSKRRIDMVNAERGQAISKRSEAIKFLEEQKAKHKIAKEDFSKAIISNIRNIAHDNDKLTNLEEAAAKLGFDEAVKTTKDLVNLAQEFTQLRGSIAVAWMSMRQYLSSGPSSFIAVLILGLCLFLAFNISVLGVGIFGSTSSIVVFFDDYIGSLAGGSFLSLSGFFAWAGSQVNSVKKGLRNAHDLQKSINGMLASDGVTDDPLKSEKDKIHRVEVDIENAENKIREAECLLEETEAEIQRINSGGLVYDFLNNRLSNSKYTENLGIISIIREDFECLRELLKDWQENDSLKDMNKDNDHSIERIVLYIDDLDRCHPNRVVEVLQAVHLLLAFDLFVVVVAVDPRWLERSLYKEYMPELFSASTSTFNNHQELQLKSKDFSPHNYLEKIFQIPFSVPEMSEEGFRDLMTSLTGEIVKPERALTDVMQEVPFTAKQFSEMPLSNEEPETNESPEDEQNLQDEKGLEPVVDINTPPPAVTIEASPIPALSDLERACLQSLHSLIKSPRQAKRLGNLYRLVRIGSMKDADSLTDFMDKKETPFVAVALMLAINITYPDISPLLFRSINNRLSTEGLFPTMPSGDWKFVEIVSELTVYLSRVNKDENIELKHVEPFRACSDMEMLKKFDVDLRQAIHTLNDSGFDAASISIQTFRDWATEVEQFSFNWKTK